MCFEAVQRVAWGLQERGVAIEGVVYSEIHELQRMCACMCTVTDILECENFLALETTFYLLFW